jgi:putative PIN family toxin of toxin-antitoxin system
MRYVVDTDAVVAGLRSPSGASAAILLAAADGRVTLLLNVALALEYEATCLLAEHRLASGLSERQIGVFLDGLISLAEPVESHFLWRPQLRDPGDEMVLEAAVNGRADAIVTFNLRDYASAPSKFGIAVLRPRDALRRIEQ